VNRQTLPARRSEQQRSYAEATYGRDEAADPSACLVGRLSRARIPHLIAPAGDRLSHGDREEDRPDHEQTDAGEALNVRILVDETQSSESIESVRSRERSQTRTVRTLASSGCYSSKPGPTIS
jgi:hypothetical protein